MSEADSNEEAARVIAQMFADDRAAGSLGISIVEAGAGFASVAFTVRDDMLNAAGSAHGGYIFALADTAFAYACNSHGDACVALQCSISFTAPGPPGMRLIATARERSLGGRTGLYDVEVASEDGAPVAFFRGTSYRVSRVG